MSRSTQGSKYSQIWLQWVGASTAGVFLLYAVLYIIAKFVGSLLGTSIEDQVPFAPLIGTSLGIMQWLVLRRYLERAGWWAVASTAGFLVGFIMFGLAISMLEMIGIDILEGDALAAIFYPLLGSALGITGWLVLRNYFVQAGWWIPATLASWILTGLMVGKSIDKTIDFLLVGLVPTAISGLALVWFLYHQNSDKSRVAKSAP